jgi:uncharacterized protein
MLFAQYPKNSVKNIGEDKFTAALPCSVKIAGFLGHKLDVCAENGVMKKDYNLYVIPFRDHTDEGGGFSGEFWGKWFTSAGLAYAYRPQQKYKEILTKSYEELIQTQEKNGRISSYKKDFGYWDIWGRKYVLLGLISYYDQTGEKKALEHASLLVHNLITVAGPGKRKLTETGLSLLKSLSSSSILEPIVLLYERTGNKKYLKFAEYLVALWSQPNKFSPHGMRLVEDAIHGVDPINISVPKGYEQMSCYEGLCELYRATGNRKYLDAVVRFGHSVLKKEIMIVGSGSSGELWCDGANRQTELLEEPMETCVTTTWIRLCYQLLRLTGDCLWADEMEVSLYNAMLGAMVPDGNWWAYFSPLEGERMPSPLQVPSMNSSCCVANGPRGLLSVPGWSLMHSKLGPIINLYAQGSWSYRLEKGQFITLNQATKYPETDNIKISIEQAIPAIYSISLRIPSWSRKTKLLVNGTEIECTPGTYKVIRRKWKTGDNINLQLDLRGRLIISRGNINAQAVMRGPIVLALDSRFVTSKDIDLWLKPENTKWFNNKQLGDIHYTKQKPAEPGGAIRYYEEYIDLKPVINKADSIWMAFKVPFLYRPTHFFNHRIDTLVMIDYASAGNQYNTKNLFRVWLPQPLFMGDIFPKGTWKILFEGESRPKVPALDE